MFGKHSKLRLTTFAAVVALVALLPSILRTNDSHKVFRLWEPPIYVPHETSDSHVESTEFSLECCEFAGNDASVLKLPGDRHKTTGQESNATVMPILRGMLTKFRTEVHSPNILCRVPILEHLPRASTDGSPPEPPPRLDSTA